MATISASMFMALDGVVDPMVGTPTGGYDEAKAQLPQE